MLFFFLGIWIYRRDNLRGMLGAGRSDLQAFRMFSQHSKWVITLVNSKKVWSIACINYFQVKRALIGKKNWF